MKKLNTKFWLVRPADGFLPGVLLLASALGQSNTADNLFQFMLFSRLFALASAIGLRQAFSRQPSMRKARGSVKAALLLQPLGALLVLGLSLIRDGGRVSPASMVYLGAGLLLNIEHVFYEYLAAAGEGHSAWMERAVCAALTFCGVMMTWDSSQAGLLPYGLEWLLGASAVSAAVSAVVALLVGGPLKGKLNGEVLRCAPTAILQCFVYPLAWALMLLIPGCPVAAARTSVPFFAGLTLVELWRTPFRRSTMEARPMNRALIGTAAAAVALIALSFLPALHKFAADIAATGVMLLAGCGCCWGMYGRLELKIEN